MASSRKIEIDCQALREKLMGDPNVVFAFLFGSYASERQKQESDLDIAVYFNSSPSSIQLLHYINELSDVCRREVDLVVLNSASPLLRHQVMKNRVPLVIKDAGIYRQFREKTISGYDEYKYVAGMMIYD